MAQGQGINQFTPGNISKFLQEVIGDFIGTYTYSDGLVVPAIAIDNVPNDVVVDGFEIIIPGFPRMPKQTNIGSRRFHICQQWDINFINHDSNKRGSLARKGEFYQMVQTVIFNYPRTLNGIPFQQADPVKSLQRYRLTLLHTDTFDSAI